MFITFETTMITATNILVLTIVVIITGYFFRKRRPTNFPPGPRRLPVIGNLHQLGMKPHETFMKLAETYGNVFGIYFGSYLAVVLNDVKSITEAFGMDEFAGRPQLRPILERNGGKPRGILLSEGKVWSDERLFLLKTLRGLGYARKTMESKIQFEIMELVETFQKENGKPISVKHSFNGSLLNSIWNIMTDERFEKDDPIFKRTTYYLTEAMSELKFSGAVFYIPTLSKLFPNWTGYNKLMHIIMASIDVIKGTVKQHKDTFQNENPRDMVDFFLQKINETKEPESSFFGAEEVSKGGSRQPGGHNIETFSKINLLFFKTVKLQYYGQAQTLITSLVDMFIGGAETTSTWLRWVFLIFAQKVEEQEKVYDEIKNVVGLSRLPSLDDRNNMPSTEAFIMEALRFCGMVPLGVFHSTVQDTHFQGHFIPEETIVYSNLYAALHDTKTWGDPDVFRPNRFLLPSGELNRHHDGFIPFSIGKRVCLGEPLARDELFLFITILIQKFKVLNDPNEAVPSLKDCSPGLVLAPKPHRLVFEERLEY